MSEREREIDREKREKREGGRKRKKEKKKKIDVGKFALFNCFISNHIKKKFN